MFLSWSTPLKRRPPYFWFITTSSKRSNHSIIFSMELELTSKFHFKMEFLFLTYLVCYTIYLHFGFYQNHKPCKWHLYAFLSQSTPLKRKPPYFWFITTSPKRRNHSIVLIGLLDYEYDKSIRDISTSTPPSLFNRLVHRSKASQGFLFKIGRLSFFLQNR